MAAPPTLTVGAAGSVPLNYQWKKDGAPIPGATGSAFTNPSAAYADAGSYSVTISNAVGSIDNAPATLTVMPEPTFAYLPADLVLHLKFDSGVADSSGRDNHGEMIGSPIFVPGKVGPQALQYNTAQDAHQSFDVYGPVKLTITPAGADLLVAWQAGTLESNTDLQNRFSLNKVLPRRVFLTWRGSRDMLRCSCWPFGDWPRCIATSSRCTAWNSWPAVRTRTPLRIRMTIATPMPAPWSSRDSTRQKSGRKTCQCRCSG